MKKDLFMSIGYFPEKKLTIKDTAAVFVEFIEKLEKVDVDFSSYIMSGTSKSKKFNIANLSYTEKIEQIKNFIIDDIKKNVVKEFGLIPDENFSKELGFNFSFTIPQERKKIVLGFNMLGGYDNYFKIGGYCDYAFYDGVPDSFGYYFELMRISVDFFKPKWCELYNRSIYINALEEYDSGAYRIGWINYFSNEIKLPSLPEDIIIEANANGCFVILTKDFFDIHNLEHYNKLERVGSIFRDMYPKTPNTGL